jgi:hypothetical protein
MVTTPDFKGFIPSLPIVLKENDTRLVLEQRLKRPGLDLYRLGESGRRPVLERLSKLLRAKNVALPLVRPTSITWELGQINSRFYEALTQENSAVVVERRVCGRLLISTTFNY